MCRESIPPTCPKRTSEGRHPISPWPRSPWPVRWKLTSGNRNESLVSNLLEPGYPGQAGACRPLSIPTKRFPPGGKPDHLCRPLDLCGLLPTSWKRSATFQPVTVAGKPFFIVRSDEATISAFHNVCRHRCLKLVETAKKLWKADPVPVSSVVLRSARPSQGGTVFCRIARNGAGRVFNGRKWPGSSPLPKPGMTGFLSISVAGPGISGSLSGPSKTSWREWTCRGLCRWPPLISACWRRTGKTLMENFIEPYHVQFVHQTTTSQPLEDHYTIIDGHCLGSACDIDESKGVDTAGTLAVTSRFLTPVSEFCDGYLCTGPDRGSPEYPGRSRPDPPAAGHLPARIPQYVGSGDRTDSPPLV